MQNPNQSKISSESIDQANHDKSQTGRPNLSVPLTRGSGFDWFALGIVILIAAFFAVMVRLNSQPPASLTPVAILSATGCGLLVTAIRKLRVARRPGLFEASLAGFFLAAFEFIAALTYPGVFSILDTTPDERLGFLVTWGLIAIFTIVFSMVGAVLGHLAFAPLRPVPLKARNAEDSVVIEDLNGGSPEDGLEPFDEMSEDEGGNTEVGEEAIASQAIRVEPQRSVISYLVTILLFGLTPFVVGYISSAVYDYILRAYSFTPGPYPTLRLFSALLPWQVPIPFHSNGSNASIVIFTQLWRIPLFLGNPALFDIQALEPFVFNAAALALLLLTAHKYARNRLEQASAVNWPLYLLLEALLGLMLVLPADVLIVRGLQGLLQIPSLGLAIPIRTLFLLNPLTFTLNLITGPLVCLIIGILVRSIKSRRNTKGTALDPAE